MLQRLIASGLGVLGLAIIGLGVASATLWRADDTLVVTAPAPGAGTLVSTAPGVLELGGGPVSVTARANGGTKVVLVIGREADVAGWVGTDAHTVITGLADRFTLATETFAAEPEPEPSPAPADPAAPTEAAPAGPAAEPDSTSAPDPDGSDLWVQQAAGEDSAELTWTPEPGRWTLLAAGAGEGAGAPTVVASWPQTVTTPWLVPGVVVGAILLLAGIVLSVRSWLRPRRGVALRRPGQAAATPAVVVAGDVAEAGRAVGGEANGPSPGPDDAPTVQLTRRALREAAASAPTPKVVPRVSFRWRAQRGEGNGSRPAAGPGPKAAPASIASSSSSSEVPAAPTPGRATRHGSPAGSERPAEDWVPRPPANPGGSPSVLSRPSSAGSTVSTAPDGDRTPVTDAVAAPQGARADAWRRAWGFPGEGAPGPAEAPTSAAAPSPAAPDGTGRPGPDAARPGTRT